MFTETLTIVSKTIPLSMDLKQIFAKSNSRDQEFVLNLALFLCSFFSAHLDVCVEHRPSTDLLAHTDKYAR